MKIVAGMGKCEGGDNVWKVDVMQGAGKQEPTCGGEAEGKLLFVYDCEAERLYAR